MQDIRSERKTEPYHHERLEGPGHGSVVVDAAGDWWLAYHRSQSSPLYFVSILT